MANPCEIGSYYTYPYAYGYQIPTIVTKYQQLSRNTNNCQEIPTIVKNTNNCQEYQQFTSTKVRVQKTLLPQTSLDAKVITVKLYKMTFTAMTIASAVYQNQS